MTPNSKFWDGNERRMQYKDDHDAIIAFGVKIDEHSKAIETLADNHDEDQDLVNTSIEKINGRVDWLFRIVWIGIGVGVTLQFIFNLYKG